MPSQDQIAAMEVAVARRLAVQGYIASTAVGRDAIAALLDDGYVLLPSGGEVSTQWSVVFQDGFRAKTFQRSMAHAYRAWLDDPSIATVGPVEERTVTTWPDGSKLTGPWSPVVSDNSEVPNAGD